MQPINVTLGLKVIPARFVPAFMDVGEDLRRDLSDAGTLVSQAPSPWEIVEERAGGGFQPQDFGLKSVPKELTDEEQRYGREQINEAYKRIEAALKQLDNRIRQLERSGLRKLLLLVGLGLVLSAVAILAIGVFRHSEIKLIGEHGAATLLLTTGISILASSYRVDRKMRTLTSRIRARLAVCLGHPNYPDVLPCFSSALEELNNAFGTIQRRIESNRGAATDIDL